jgi:V8-like Glu-specific endopeptidase
MHKRIFAFLYILFSFHFAFSESWITPRAVYGEDDREEVRGAPLPWMKKAKAVGGFLFSKSYTDLPGGGIRIKPQTLKERYQLCDGEPFENQKLGPDCTGFLVGDDLLVTAGHCLRGKTCPQGVWIFDFELDGSGRVRETYHRQELYRCVEVLSASKGNLRDHGLIRLDRSPGREPLKLSPNFPKLKEAVVVIGHPSGLPKKLGSGGEVRALEKSGSYFTSNLDTFSGNSGSPVLSESTGLVQGILVRGDEDYESTSEGCSVTKRCDPEGCEGEDATTTVFLAEMLSSLNPSNFANSQSRNR